MGRKIGRRMLEIRMVLEIRKLFRPKIGKHGGELNFGGSLFTGNVRLLSTMRASLRRVSRSIPGEKWPRKQG